jgi:hypothetical protein
MPGTRSVQDYSFQFKGINVNLVDTPGFDDTYKSDADVLNDISRFLSETYSTGTKLSGVIYLHSISNKRAPGLSSQSLHALRNLISDKTLGNVVLGTTHWDSVSQADRISLEDSLKSDAWKPFLEDGARIMRYVGGKASALDILDSFFEKKKAIMDIQRDLVNEGSRLLTCRPTYVDQPQRFINIQQPLDTDVDPGGLYLHQHTNSKVEGSESPGLGLVTREQVLVPVRGEYVQLATVEKCLENVELQSIRFRTPINRVPKAWQAFQELKAQLDSLKRWLELLEVDLLMLLEKTDAVWVRISKHFRRLQYQLLFYSLVFFYSFSEFPRGMRHICTTMPWTICPALVVLWGVCWMFYPPLSEDGVGGDTETRFEIEEICETGEVECEYLASNFAGLSF